MNSKKLFIEVVKNWPAKVLSVALALVLVVFHRMSTLEERLFSVPLEILDEGPLTPVTSYDGMIRVSLRGEHNSIVPIAEDDIEAYIDLSKYTEPGVFRIPVQIRKKGSALGVEPLEINLEPLEISLELDHRANKSVPLIPDFRGAVENGYELSSHALVPARVSIEGPQKLVESISGFKTSAIDLDRRRENFSQVVNIQNQDPLVLILGGPTAEFRGSIQERIIDRVFNDIPIVPTDLDRRFTAALEQETGTIRLQGGWRDLGNYNPPADFLTLNCSGIHSPGTYTLPVMVNMPASFSLFIQDPAEVSVRVNVSVNLAGGGRQ